MIKPISPSRNRKFPPGHFQLRHHLGAIAGLLYELRIDLYPDAPFCDRLAQANQILMDVVIEDELGLIDVTPEQRAAFAEGIR